ncbi:MAG TPA: HEAT repeat domain-containing protein [Acidobacteriota bacterium]
MKKHAFGRMAQALLAVSILYAFVAAVPAAAAPAQESSQFLKGKVVKWNDSALSLEKRLNTARDHFRAANQGDLYFTGYLFPSRIKIHHHLPGQRGPFQVMVEDGKIRFRGQGNSESIEGDDQAGPVGLLLLNSLAAPRAGTLSARLIDPERSYEFKNVPVYWLGSLEADTSVAFLVKTFEGGVEELQESLLFIISQHNTPRSFDFLKTIALSPSRSLEIRKNAVFWVGNSRDPRSLNLLKEILGSTRDEELKEQVVFALTLTDRREAVAELIRIAKSDPDREVRKKAIFWLGQKASQEAVKTLKDVVDKPDEDVEVKESAVFAISQLPKDKAVPLLVAIARENKSPSVRKKAIFWLGQTGEKEALELFEEILLKKN